MAVKPIPDGYQPVIPYLVGRGIPRLIDFLKQAFNGEEIHRMADPDGQVRHAEVRLGGCVVMMGEASKEFPAKSASLYFYVPDVDETYKRAMAAGGVSTSEPKTQFYGDRHAGVKDPCGNEWWIATRVEEVSPEEMERRSKAAAQSSASAG